MQIPIKVDIDAIGSTSTANATNSSAAVPPIAQLKPEPLPTPHQSRSNSVASTHQIAHPPAMPHFGHIDPAIQPLPPLQPPNIIRQNAVQPAAPPPPPPHPQVHAPKMEQPSPMANANFAPPIEPYDQQSYGGQYNSSYAIHSAMSAAHTADYTDANYYNNFCAPYDDQMRPYSASSNSCSSSNSDGDNSHMAYHPHAMQTAHTNGHDELLNMNCFGGIGNVGLHNIADDLHMSYVHGGVGGGHAAIGSNPTGIVLNGTAANAEANVLYGATDLNGGQVMSDAFQYTSVIVEPNNFHMANEYVH